MNKTNGLNPEKIVYAMVIIFLGLVILMAFQYYNSDNKILYRSAALSKTKISQDGTSLKSDDGSAMLVLYSGTQSDSDEISIQRIENPAIDSATRVSEMYKFGPSGARFSKPVEVRIKYDEEKVGECPAGLYFYHFNDYGAKKEIVASKKIYCGISTAVFEINSFSEGYVAAVNCNDPKGTIPQIGSVSKSTAGRSDTLEISGRDLAKTVQFYSGKNKYTYTGQVDSGCAKTTIKVPSDLPAGDYTLNIYKAKDKISNGKSITITGESTQVSGAPSCENDIEDDTFSKRGARAKDDVALFTECRDVVWMTRNTNTALACSSDFTFNGVPAATWKSWVENEAKNVLDACKDVCHPGVDVGCEKQPDSVDKDKLIQALENYWKNCIHRKGISCVCNPNPSDPVCGPFVQFIGNTGSGTAGTTALIIQVTPTNSWSPKETSNGWFPQISPDGNYVAYGFGEVWIANSQTGEEKSFTQVKGQSFAGGWIKSDTYTFVNTPDNSNADRYEIKAGEWNAKKISDNSKLVAGNQFAAADGHWASWLAKDFRIAYDNSVLATNAGGALSISDDWIVHATDKDNSAIQVWHNKQKIAAYTPKTPLFGMSVNKGYILYGGYGPVHGITPEGQDIDLTVAPWKWEGIGGVIFVDGNPWIYTSTWDNSDNKGYILIRPWGEKTSIVIEGGAVSVHVVYVNNEFVVAFNNDKGQLKVVKVPANSQRVDLNNLGQQTTNPNNPTQSPTTGTTSAVDATPGWLGDAAFDSKNNKWLVVSKADGPIYGSIMGNDGKAISDVFKISSDELKDGWSPLTAYSPDADKYLVVWIDYTNGGWNTYGRFVSSDKTFGNQFGLNLDKPWLNVGGDRTSSLKYDLKNKKFVFIWENRAGYQSAILTTIDLDGKIGPLVELTDGQYGGANGPSIAVNEDKNEYCAVYDLRNSGKWAVRKIDASTLTAGVGSAVDFITTNTDITYNSKDKKYLVIYDAGYNIGVMGRFLNSCDANDVAKEVLVLQKEGYSSVASNPASTTYAAIGQNGQDAGNGYSIIDSSGKILSSGNLFSDGYRNGQFLPVIRANVNDGTFAATSSRDYEMTRFVANIGSSQSTANPSNPTAYNPTITKELGSGTFPDVEFYNGRLWLAVQQEDELKLHNFALDLSDQQVTTFPIYSGLAFPKLTVNNNILWMAYRIGENSANVVPESVKLWRSDTQQIEDLGGGLGNNPVEVGNGYIAWQKDGKVQRRLLTGGGVVAVRDQLPTGISRILPDGSIKMIDEDKTAIPNYYDPSWAGDITVAEDNDNGVVYFFNNNIGVLSRIWQGITTLAPKAAADTNGNYAVATWSPRSSGDTVRVAVIKKS